jgi:hypothetical protein
MKNETRSMTTVTTRHYLAGVLAVLATFAGIGAYHHLSEQAAAHECVAKGYAVDQCWDN